MKITLILIMLGVSQIFAEGSYAQRKELTLDFENVKVEQILDEIENQSEFYFLYNKKLVNTDFKTSAKFSDEKIFDVLDQLFAGRDVFYQVIDNQIILIPDENKSAKTQQQTEVSGKITDAQTGEPLPGVNIVIEGTTQGTTSDMNGEYSLVVPPDAILLLSFVGYQDQTVEVKGREEINIALKQAITELEEVVAVGYGTVKRSDLTGSVSRVTEENIATYPALDVTQALQGKSAGVNVTADNHTPGSSPRIRIRGYSSINASTKPLIVVDGFTGGDWPPPEDIASIEILKDASATAIYGSRGANGVVLIETKRGQSGKTKIDFKSSYSFQREINRYDLLNATQMAEYINESRINSSENPEEVSVPFPNPSSYGKGTDWQEEVFRQGGLQNYQLSLSSGTENAKYYVSGSVYDQQGVVLNSGYSRYSITGNLDISPLDVLDFGINLFGQRSKTNGVRTQSGSPGAANSGVTSSAFRFEPTKPVKDENGNYTIAELHDAIDNPVAVAKELTRNNINDRMQANIQGKLDILEELTLNVRFNAKMANIRDGEYTPTTLQAAKGTGGNASLGSDKNTLLRSENFLTYTDEFGASHNLSLMGGYSYEFNRYESIDAYSRGFITDAGLYWNLQQGSTLQAPYSDLTRTKLSSFYGRLNYELLDRYLITINGRYDGASQFAKNNKWAFFPSGAIAWRIAQEPFMQNINQLSQLKLRASYGNTGNQAINAYQSLARFGSTVTVINNQYVNAVIPTAVANDNLTWENTEQIDIGIDIGLFNQRLLMTADYYKKETSDLLFSKPLPNYSGYSSQLANIGRIENKGFEFSLTSVNFQGEFNWETNFNISTNKNKVLELPQNNKTIYYRSAPGNMVGVGNTHVLQVGDPLASMYGYIYDGVYQQGETPIEGAFDPYPGGRKFKDIATLNEEGEVIYEPDGILSSADRTIIANPHPDFIWGFKNSFSYKGFDLNLFFQGSQGNDIYSYDLMAMNMMAGQWNATKAALNRWTPNNTDTDVPIAHRRSRKISNRFVFDGSYIRLKNVMLGYNIPKNILNEIGIRSLKLYVSAQNVLTITDYPGYDPEINYQASNRSLGLDSGGYPNIESYTFGLNLGF